MGAQENKTTAEAAYRAFNAGDAATAMENIDEAVVWTTRGDNALTGTCNGKQEVGELWAQLVGKGFQTSPHGFIADGDTVVVLTTVTLDGETVDSADVLTYDSDGMLITFDTLGDPKLANRAFPR